MKYRKGFISNSSSDSFILATNKTAEQFNEWLLGVYNAIFEVKEKNLDKMMKIKGIDEDGVKAFKEEIKVFYTDDYNNTVDSDLSYIMRGVKEKNLTLLRIDSIEDNSIPHGIQNLFEGSAYVYRQHWG